MAQGTPRRQETADSLAGAAQVQPTTRSAPSISGSANRAAPMNSFTSQTLKSVQGWSSKKVNEAVSAKRQRSDMEGQVAFQQGKTFDEVEMTGDKFALNGYRVMQAQTASASVLAQQQQAIKDGGYEDDPDTFRNNYGEAVEASLKGLDPTTATMVRETMTRQMPGLVQQHMTGHLAHQENKAFSALAQSINIMSKDDSADADLIMNAVGGEFAPSAGLSDARRTAAVVEGITQAFQEGNPKAYAKLVKAGALDDLSSGQRNSIASAEAAFTRQKSEQVDKDWIGVEASIIDSAASGEMSGPEALDAYVLAAENYGQQISATTGKAIYLSAEQARRYHEQGDSVLIEAATLRGDWQAYAAITEPMMVHMESGGDPNAVSPKGARGTHQVMKDTIADPGYGIKPADITDPQDVARVGKEYWRTMISGKASGYPGINWEPMDLEAAAIAYNAGPANAKKWIDAGRDYSVLPKREETEPYAKGILARAKGAGAIPPRERLAKAKAIKDAIIEQSNMIAYEAYMVNQTVLDEKLTTGELTDAEYFKQSNDIRHRLGVDRTKAITGHVIDQMAAVHATALKDADAATMELADARAAELTNAFEAEMSIEGQSPEFYQRATQEHIAKLATLYTEQGIVMADFNYSGIVDHATKQLHKSLDAHSEWSTGQVRIARAIETDTVDKLPKELQERAFEDMTEEVGQAVSNMVTSNPPKGPINLDKFAADATKQALEENYLSMGMVDPRVKDESSQAISGELVNGNGEINTRAMNVIQSYARMKRQDPAVAKTMFDSSSLLIAEGVISAAGGINAPIQDGMVRWEQSKAKVGNFELNDPKMLDETRKKIKSAVDGRFGFGGIVRRADVGIVQAIFGDAQLGDIFHRSDADEDYLRSEETSDRLQNWIEVETMRLAKLQPGADPKYLVDLAVQRVTANTDFVGGEFVNMNEGYGIRTQLFGSEVRKYDKADIANEVITDHLRSLAKDPNYSFLKEASFLQALNPFGKDIDSVSDVLDAKVTGLRPFKISSINGRDTFVQVLLQTGGYSEGIELNLPTIGAEYKKRYSSKFARKTIPSAR